MDRPLKGQWAIVTGATSGIGRATALRLGELGANVAIHYHSHPEAASDVVAQIKAMGQESRSAQGDFRRQDDVFRVVQELLGENRLDILVNNAGTLIHRYGLEDMPLNHWDDTIALNLSSTFWAVRAALPALREGARIINVSSIAAETGGGPGAFAYAAAKGGVISLTRGLAKQLAHRGVRVNAVAPGTIDTPFHEQHTPADALAEVAQRIPLKRLGSSEECAGVIAFLAGSDSSYVTGELITVHGGQGLAW